MHTHVGAQFWSYTSPPTSAASHVVCSFLLVQGARWQVKLRQPFETSGISDLPGLPSLLRFSCKFRDLRHPASVCVLGQRLWLRLGTHWASCYRKKRQSATTMPFSGSAAYRSHLLWCTGLSSSDWCLLPKLRAVLAKAKLAWSRMPPSMHGCLAGGREAGQPASCTWHWKLLGCGAEHVWARIWQHGKDGV